MSLEHKINTYINKKNFFMFLLLKKNLYYITILTTNGLE